MPFLDKKSPFGDNDKIARQKKAFSTIATLAVISFCFMAFGVYRSFIATSIKPAVFSLTAAEHVINPQPPAVALAGQSDAESEQTEAGRLIQDLEQAKKKADETVAALQEMSKKPDVTEKTAIEKLQDERDAAEKIKLAQIENLEKERLKKSEKKESVQAAPDAALKAPKTEKQPEKESLPAVPQKPKIVLPDLTAPSEIAPVAPMQSKARKTPNPDLITTSLNASLPNFSLIKKGGASAVVPLHIIDPLPELQKESKYGKLPVKDKNGNSAFTAYSKTVEIPPKTPYIAVLFSGLGKRKNVTNAAIGVLPEVVSFSFSPYAPNLKTRITDARKSGHETLVDLPMQQGFFPDTDPGPLGLVSGLPEQENRTRLYKTMGVDLAYIGLSATPMENFSYTSAQMKPFAEEINMRGLLYIDGTDDSKMPLFKNTIRPDVYIYDNFYRAAIRAKLDEVKEIAQKNGSAFLRVEAMPITLLCVTEWMKSFIPESEEFVPELTFVPLSYYVKQKKEKNE